MKILLAEKIIHLNIFLVVTVNFMTAQNSVATLDPMRIDPSAK